MATDGTAGIADPLLAAGCAIIDCGSNGQAHLKYVLEAAIDVLFTELAGIANARPIMR